MRTTLTGIFLIACLSHSFGQKTVFAKTGDKAELTADQYRGEIQWEFSADKISWNEIAGANAQLLTYDLLTLPIHLRSRIDELGCDDSHYSEVITFLSSDHVELWSDPTTWTDLGGKPQEGDEVTIPGDKLILLDESTPDLAGLTINGTLIFDNKDLSLTSEWILLTGLLQIGTEEIPFENNAVITLNDSDTEASLMNMGTRGLMVMGGQLELHGAAPSVIWTKLNEHAANGATSLSLIETPDWRVGDEIIVTPTDFYGAAGGFSYTQKMTLASVNDTEVGLMEPLDAFRWGRLQYPTSAGLSLSSTDIVIPPAEEGETPLVLDERAEVAHLSRNIVIQAPEDAVWLNEGFGVHTMIMPGSSARVEGVEFRRAGQRGRIRRYPFHWHMLSYAGATTLEDATGQYLKKSVIHESENRGIVIHGTNGVLVQDNIVYRTKGHGVFMEDAVERRNVIDHNLVAYVRDPAWIDRLMNHEVGFSPEGSSGFWIANPDNTVTNNVAADCQNFGYWLAFPTQPFGESAAVLGDNGTLMRPNRMPFGLFDNNTAHSNRNDGLHIDNPQVDDQGNVFAIQYLSTLDGQLSTIQRFTISRLRTWKNSDNGMWDRGAWTDIYEIVSADNCGRFFAGSGAEGVIERSLVVGTSLNHLMNGTGRPPTADGMFFFESSTPTAFATYHSTFDIRDNIVVNFPVTQNGRAGVFASDDYYLRPVDKGMIRNSNNLLIGSHYGVKVPAAWSYYTLASALWDPYGFWGPAGNYFVYDNPFLTYGKPVSIIEPGTEVSGGVSVPGPFYGVSAFILDGTTSQDLDLRAIHVDRYNPANLTSTVGSWSVITADSDWPLNHMRDFAVVKDGVYELNFPDDPPATNFLMEVENMLELEDSFVISIEFDGSVIPEVLVRNEFNHNIFTFYDEVGSREEVINSSGETWWQDHANDRIWARINGGRWAPANGQDGFEDLAYEKMQFIIRP